jgi:hypothetical protein
LDGQSHHSVISNFSSDISQNNRKLSNIMRTRTKTAQNDKIQSIEEINSASVASLSSDMHTSIDSVDNPREYLMTPDKNGQIQVYNVQKITAKHKEFGTMNLTHLRRLGSKSFSEVLSFLHGSALYTPTERIHNHSTGKEVSAVSASKSSNYNFLGWQNVQFSLHCHDLFGFGYIAMALSAAMKIHGDMLARLPRPISNLIFVLEFCLMSLIIWQFVRLVTIIELAGTLTHEITHDTWTFVKFIAESSASTVGYITSKIIG